MTTTSVSSGVSSGDTEAEGLISFEPFISSSPEETEAFGVRLGATLKEGACVALYGELGSGKTHLTRGIARGLGYTGAVKSPSFTIMQIYEGGRLPVYHIDLYRLDGASGGGSLDSLGELGLEEYTFGEGVTVIEWAEQGESILPDDAIRIELEYVDEHHRRIRVASL